MKSLRKEVGEKSISRGEATIKKADKMLQVAIAFDDAMYALRVPTFVHLRLKVQRHCSSEAHMKFIDKFHSK